MQDFLAGKELVLEFMHHKTQHSDAQIEIEIVRYAVVDMPKKRFNVAEVQKLETASKIASFGPADHTEHVSLSKNEGVKNLLTRPGILARLIPPKTA